MSVARLLRERPAGLLAALALVPTGLAVGTLGRVHPDEVYQALEPAFFRVHGYGVLAWEWQPAAGLRNWAYPLLLASFLRPLTWLGVEHPWAARAAVALTKLLLHGLALLALRRHGPLVPGVAPAILSVLQIPFGIGVVLAAHGSLAHDVFRVLHVGGAGAVWASLVAAFAVVTTPAVEEVALEDRAARAGSPVAVSVR